MIRTIGASFLGFRDSSPFFGLRAELKLTSFSCLDSKYAMVVNRESALGPSFSPVLVGRQGDVGKPKVQMAV